MPAPAASRPGTWPCWTTGSYVAALVRGLWAELGGTLAGGVRDGAMPVERTRARRARVAEPRGGGPRHQQVQQQRDGARALPVDGGRGGEDAGQRGSRAARACAAFYAEREPRDARPRRSRTGRGCRAASASVAASMGRVLQAAWASPVMPEFIASLPLVGLRRHDEAAAEPAVRRGSGAHQDRHARRRAARSRATCWRRPAQYYVVSSWSTIRTRRRAGRHRTRCCSGSTIADERVRRIWHPSDRSAGAGFLRAYSWSSLDSPVAVIPSRIEQPEGTTMTTYMTNASTCPKGQDEPTTRTRSFPTSSRASTTPKVSCALRHRPPATRRPNCARRRPLRSSARRSRSATCRRP